MADKCPICNSDVNKPTYYHDPKTSVPMHFYSCPRCGEYDMPYHLSQDLPSFLNKDLRKIAVLSHWVRKQYDAMTKEPPDKTFNKRSVPLNEQLMNSVIKNPLPTPAEQANNIVRWLGSKSLGEPITVKPVEQISIMGAETVDGFELILDALLNQKHLLKGKIYRSSVGLGGDITLSFEGWEYYEKLKKGASESRKAFMAMKYGDEQLDKIVEEVFKPAVEETGFKLFKLVDKPQPAGLIDDRIRVEIQTSRFIMADLTHENRGAYWEAGYAEGLGKPVIYTCEKRKFKRLKTHFDTNHHLTILWDAQNPQEAAEKLKATIQATLPKAAKLTDD